MKKIIKNLLSVVVLAIIVFTILEVLKLNILPIKYLFFFLLGEGFLFLIGFIFFNMRKKGWMVLGVFLYFLSVLGNVVGFYYLNKTNRYIDDNFAVETYKVTTHYYVVKNAWDPISTIDELPEDATIQYYLHSRSIEIALAKLGTHSYYAVDNEYNIMTDIKNGPGKYFLVPDGNFYFLIEASNSLSEESYAILYEFDVEEEYVKNSQIKDTYNVYINAYDYTGIHSDFNMIATVNTKTHQVLLTSIPRDYYLDVPAYHMKDTLTYMGALDPKISKDALENLFQTKIDYTISLNTNSLVSVVDTLGGIEFCSDTDFYTTHDMTFGSYADKGEKLHVTKGCRLYQGKEILAIARERVHIKGGDRARQENCRKILINIMKKLASTTTLTNYDEVLNSFNGLYTTNMNKDTITSLIREGLNNPNFEVMEQSVDGVDGTALGAFGTGNAWIVDPDMNTVNAASEKIKEVLDE